MIVGIAKRHDNDIQTVVCSTIVRDEDELGGFASTEGLVCLNKELGVKLLDGAMSGIVECSDEDVCTCCNVLMSLNDEVDT